MNALMLLLGTGIVLMIAVMQAGSDAMIKSMKHKADVGMKLGKETKTQMQELQDAQSLYFKTYKQYPVGGVDELIAKGFLRANFKTTTISKNITLDANNSVTTTNTTITNGISNNYINAQQNSLNAKGARQKAEQSVNENVENFVNNL